MQLVNQPNQKVLTAVEIAKREGISVAYANKLLHILRHSGLVESARGGKGGFRLTRPAADITLADVMRALDSFLFEKNICACFPGKKKECVHFSKSCTIRAVWHVMLGEVRSLLTRTTLKELVGSPERSVAALMQAKVLAGAKRFSLPQ